VIVTGADGADPLEPPLMAPLARDLDWARVQAMSQSAAYRDDPQLRRIRATAAVRRGTRMTKILSAAQVAGHLAGWLPYGFCHRCCDIAHVRRPADLAARCYERGVYESWAPVAELTDHHIADIPYAL
jgi:hypothetical protein